jgi:protein-S-isoprenylcysteine O-methyltransferase Ste14
MSDSFFSKIFVALRGILFSSLFVLLWVWIAVSLRQFDKVLPMAIPGWLLPVGLILVSVGALFAIACVATFITKGRGTPAPFDPPRKFVASGPYRLVRNPMYLGAAAVLLGSGMISCSPSIILLGLGSLILAHLVVVLYEEPVLTKQFGEPYLQYKTAVKRWVIRWPKPTV